MERILQEHQDAGRILTGKFNQLKHHALIISFNLNQIVKNTNMGNKTLDKFQRA